MNDREERGKRVSPTVADRRPDRNKILRTRAVIFGVIIGAFALAGPAFGQDEEALKAGVRVWRIAGCGGCHGTFAEGGEGGQEIAGPSLRQSTLARDDIMETVRCGRGPMPAFDEQAYVASSCYGAPAGEEPEGLTRGRSLTPEQVAAVVDYLTVKIVGAGEPTLEDCAFLYGNADHPGCARF